MGAGGWCAGASTGAQDESTCEIRIVGTNSAEANGSHDSLTDDIDHVVWTAGRLFTSVLSRIMKPSGNLKAVTVDLKGSKP